MASSLFVDVQQGAVLRVCRDLVQLRTQKPLQFVDLTALLAERVRRSGVGEGVITAQSRHTTAALVVNENEPMLIEDLEDELERLAPRSARYRHDDLQARSSLPPDERRNGHAHARALLLSASVCLNVAAGRLDLGEWQSVFLVELDGPRPRSVSVQVLGIAGAMGGRP